MAGTIGDGEFGFQIAPMLDILFVLLLFFMVSAGSQKHEASIVTQLPGIGPGGAVSMQIGIDEDGQVSIANSPVGGPDDRHLQELIDRLKTAVAQDANRSVVVTPTRSTKQQRVIDVLNACQAARVKNLAFGPVAD